MKEESGKNTVLLPIIVGCTALFACAAVIVLIALVIMFFGVSIP